MRAVKKEVIVAKCEGRALWFVGWWRLVGIDREIDLITGLGDAVPIQETVTGRDF
jgi:hypothetical protein